MLKKLEREIKQREKEKGYNFKFIKRKTNFHFINRVYMYSVLFVYKMSIIYMYVCE